MKKGILYGVGVGPGDPELLTLKGARILREADLIAVPTSGAGRKTALQIIESIVKEKPLMVCDTPMTRDRNQLSENYDSIAKDIEEYLNQGKTVAFITLGDPSIYSTYLYLHRRVESHGYEAHLIPGVPSFCAVAARLGMALCEGSQMLHIVPSSHQDTEEALALPGTKVLMKAGRGIHAVLEDLKKEGKLEQASMVECCGMENEKVYPTVPREIDNASYFSVIVIREDPV